MASPGRKSVVILIVDDSRIRALALQRIFDDELFVFRFATSAAAALQQIESTELHVIIANETISGTDGVSLLETARRRRPSVLRVLITDDLWPDVAMEAINRAAVHRIISRRMESAQLVENLCELVNDYLASGRPTDDWPEVTDAIDMARLAKRDAAEDQISVERGSMLILLSGGGPGRIYALIDEMLIGRDSRSTIWLPTKDVSRQHARLSVGADGSVLLEDLESRNGTRVNDNLIDKKVLRSGDIIQIGLSTKLLFKLS